MYADVSLKNICEKVSFMSNINNCIGPKCCNTHTLIENKYAVRDSNGIFFSGFRLFVFMSPQNFWHFIR